jgi:hypothetical protein
MFKCEKEQNLNLWGEVNMYLVVNVTSFHYSIGELVTTLVIPTL